MMNVPSVAAIILTKNEEEDLPACLESLAGVVSEVFVVDSGSTDRTLEIAERYRVRVLTHSFLNHAAQLNWALSSVNTTADWLLRIDADERLSEELRRELQERLPCLGSEVTGLLVPLQIHFLGRYIRHGDSYPVWLLRLWRRGIGRCEDIWMDERIVLSEGQVLKLHGDLIHEIPKSLSEWTRKHDWYAGRECRDILTAATRDDRPPTGQQARLKRLLKRHLYLRLPAFHRAFLYWFYRYFLRLGFLDGKEGLIYHFLQAFWYRFLVDAKLYELQKSVGKRLGEQETQVDYLISRHEAEELVRATDLRTP
jgi:glycosyltransferase involved in cell wall biosynthesis